MLIQTVTFNKIDLNEVFKTIKERLERLENRWETEFKNIDIDDDGLFDDECNINQLQFDLILRPIFVKNVRMILLYFVDPMYIQIII